MSLLLAFALIVQASRAPQDSVDIRRAAQAAQGRFERFRREHLPWYHGGGFDHCDEIIGRYCLQYGDREELSESPPDSTPVVDARDRLLTELASARRALPGDEWITGQHVRYLVEARHLVDAIAAASSCRPASGWWCLALIGYAYHGAREYETADSVFAAALAVMPSEERCRWTNLAPLLSGQLAAYRRLSCEARDSLADRFWWLADPLYLVPGNDRRTEHYSRWVMNRVQADAVSPRDMSWGDDQRDMLIRFGWPTGWSRSRRGSSSSTADIVGHSNTPRRAYEPPARYMEDPATIARGDWSLVPDRPRGGYVPAYAARVDPLDNQVAVFRRPDSVVVVAGFDFRTDSVTAETPVRAATILWSGPQVRPVVALKTNARGRDVVALRAPAESGIVSLEALAGAQRRAARARYWLSLEPPVPGRIALSDLLLLSRADDLPTSLEEATPLARWSATVAPETVGLFWEVYGLGPGVLPYALSVTVVRESAGFLRRAARAIGLAGDERPQVRLAWTGVSDPREVTTGALALDLSTARPGRYTVRLAVSARGDSALTVRNVIIRQPSPR